MSDIGNFINEQVDRRDDEDFVFDDEGNKVRIGDFVRSYYNRIDGVDSRGDAIEYLQIKNKEDFKKVIITEDSEGRCLKRITEDEYDKWRFIK